MFVQNFNSMETQNIAVGLDIGTTKICCIIGEVIDDEKIANSLALDAIKRGANSIQFKASKPFDPKSLLKGFPGKILLYFQLSFLEANFQTKLAEFCDTDNTVIQLDIIGNLAESGNWFKNLKEDHNQLEKIVAASKNCISISGDLYQNAGANIPQQLAYTLAHANEYLNYFGAKVNTKINFNFAVGTNYFFEIAKLRAFRILWKSLLKEYKIGILNFRFSNLFSRTNVFLIPLFS